MEVWTASVNGKQVRTIIKNHEVLLDVLRDGIGSLGTKRGCDMGTCGCCTVLIDGKPRLSCMTLALEAKDRQVTTVEGLSEGHHLHPIQEMFAECGAVNVDFVPRGSWSQVRLCWKQILPQLGKRQWMQLKETCAGAQAINK